MGERLPCPFFLELLEADIINRVESVGGTQEYIDWILRQWRSSNLTDLSDVDRSINILSESTHDYLTQLYNRRSFTSLAEVELDKAIRFQQPLVVTMIDLDYFKKINDNLGHGVGDEALVFLAEFLRDNLRKGDLIGRWGGEEFILLLPNTYLDQNIDGCQEGDGAGALALTTRLTQNFATNFHIFLVEKGYLFDDQAENPGSFSLGLTELSDHDTFDLIIERADKAVYSAKKDGRNQVKIIRVGELGSLSQAG